MQASLETEVKIRVADLSAIERKLYDAGFHVHVARAFESNTLYDNDGRFLNLSGHILRLRRIADRNVMTFKGKEFASAHKTREEIETVVGSADAVHAILRRIGYYPVFRYEKYRTEYKHREEDPGVVTVDETPIGEFLELEGPTEWIDANAGRLGFSRSDYILESYGKLYLADCERRGVEPTNMVFPS